MTTATNKTELVKVSKLPVLKVIADSKRDDMFKLQSITPAPADKKKADVMQAVAKFSTDFKQVKAPDLKQAIEKYNSFLDETFTTLKTAPKKRTATATKKKATAEKATGETKKTAPEEKAIAVFEYFQENSKVKCLPLSPENKKAVETSLKQFERYNKTLFSKLSETEEKELLKTANIKAVDSLINRNTLRLLIVETDKKSKKTTAMYLMKVLYFSPYSFLCVAEAHKRAKDSQSQYDSLINSVDSQLTCYDSFQFNPLSETLTTAETDKANTSLSYQFVNIVSEAR